MIVLLALLLSVAGNAGAQTVTLKDCLASAAATNRELKAASYSIGIAEEQIRVARSSLLPRVDVQGGYVAQLEPQAFKLGPVTADTQNADYPFFSLAIYDTLYDFGRTRAREAQARLQHDAAKQSYTGNEQDLFLQVVRAYYGILQAEKVVKAANDEVVQMTSHQQIAKALFDAGSVTRNDLLQAEVRVASSRQKLYSALNNVENGWLQLNYLTGNTADFRGALQEEKLPPVQSPQGQPDLSRRGEITAARDAVSSGDYAVKEAKTEYYPEFFAKLGMDYVQNTNVKEQTIYSGTLGFKINLYDGLATTSRLRQAVQARSRDEERLRDLEERVRLELATAQNDLKVAAARVKVVEQAIAQGVENLRITENRYQEKVGTATEVVDAQTLLTQTRTDYYQSVFDLQVAAARVKRATGDL